MFLFLIGADLEVIVLVFLGLLIIGLITFWLTKKLFRKVMKDGSDKRIVFLSRFSAFILSPLIVVGTLAFLLYTSVRNRPIESDEDVVKRNYEMMEADINRDLRLGMSKAEVVGLFGTVDTTQAILIYDMSWPETTEKYVLEITFDHDGVREFKRRR